MRSVDNATTDSSNTIIIIAILTTINSHQKAEDFMLQTIVFNILLLQVITQAHNHHPKGITIVFLDHHHLVNDA
jgi:hypothetical protein